MTKQLELISESRHFDGFFKIDEITFRHTLYRGGWSSEIKRELFGRGEAVIVLLYDSKAEKVVLIEQCRAGALGRAGLGRDAQKAHTAWLIEPVAGMIDEGESALDACQREADEEAGVKSAKFEFVCRFYPSPGGSDEILHLYAADIDASQLPEYAGLEHEGEDIRIIQYTFEEVKLKLKNAEFNVASTIIALQWLFFQKLNPLF
ncbi:NUDIX domain-containing protein [Hydrogenovibrio kuenenii]|uniref:NUDIX domain-containing protein n=1 Tax=Hydrogenovibrio kuenenii TaxID=63658 RepID=UPI000465FBCC|nr:NUDIX domain-containing protein [Hydrogenovibrio kuenenii]